MRGDHGESLLGLPESRSSLAQTVCALDWGAVLPPTRPHFFEARASRQVSCLPPHRRRILVERFQDDVDRAERVGITSGTYFLRSVKPKSGQTEIMLSSGRRHSICVEIPPAFGLRAYGTSGLSRKESTRRLRPPYREPYSLHALSCWSATLAYHRFRMMTAIVRPRGTLRSLQPGLGHTRDLAHR